MDAEYILDSFSDHHELALTAADIEAIGSGYASPIPDPAVPQDEQHQQQHEPVPEEQIHHDLNSMDHGYDDGDFLPEPHYPPEVQEGEDGAGTGGEGGDEPGPSRRGMGRKADAGMSAEEKKKKQREANKKAAERSRAKRRKDLDSTENQVTQLRRENERLRARLHDLRSNAPASSPRPDDIHGASRSDYHHTPRSASASPQPYDPHDTGIDRAYHHKLAMELVNAKTTLLEKHFELERIRGREENEAIENARRELVAKYASVSALRAEDAAMNHALRLLGTETIELGARRRAIEAEVKRRGGTTGQAEGSTRVDHAREEEELKRTQEEEAASHTQVLAQAVRDVAMGEAREMHAEVPGEEDGVEKDVYDIQPYIEQVMDDWHEQHHED